MEDFSDDSLMNAALINYNIKKAYEDFNRILKQKEKEKEEEIIDVEVIETCMKITKI